MKGNSKDYRIAEMGMNDWRRLGQGLLIYKFYWGVFHAGQGTKGKRETNYRQIPCTYMPFYEG